MLTIWTKNLKTDEERDNFQSQVFGARPVLERLTALLEEKEAELGRAERSKAVYANPNWAYLQAHQNGCANMLQSIKELINLDHQRNNEPTYKHSQRQP